jgi:TonB family protein
MRHALLLLAALAVPAVPAAAQQSPPEDPPLGAAFDSAAVVAALAALPDPVGKPLLVFLHFDDAGRFAGLEPMGDYGRPELARAMDEVLRRHGRALPPRSGGYFRRAVVGGGASATLAPLRGLEQPPSLPDRGMVGEAARRLARMARERRLTGRREIQVRLRVEADGTVSSGSVHQSSGDAALDAEALRLGQALRFDPGRVAGRATPVYVLLPFRVGG